MRRVLSYIVFIQIIIGVGFTAIPFIASLNPPEYLRNIEYKRWNTSKVVNLSQLKEGELLTVAWQGAPIGIYRRMSTDLDMIVSLDEFVFDPWSQFQSNLKLPSWWKYSIDIDRNLAHLKYRSNSTEYFVFNQVSPVSGCMIIFVQQSDAFKYDLSKAWPGGFYDPCYKIGYDFAGRIFKGQGSGKHLQVPPYILLDGNKIELYPNG